MISIYDYHNKKFLPDHAEFDDYIRDVNVKKRDASNKNVYETNQTLVDLEATGTQEH